MTTTTPTGYSDHTTAGHDADRRVWTFTETKAGVKTTEFVFMVLFIAGVLIATYIDGDDSLHAEEGWLYAAIAASAYFISRGLAKCGSREPYSTER
ncbi:MAG TPA: hypothetical protein VFU19_16365 [Iamia sp.]|nr:hypothetical protein [Iamia sp.]